MSQHKLEVLTPENEQMIDRQTLKHNTVALGGVYRRLTLSTSPMVVAMVHAATSLVLGCSCCAF